MTDLQIDELLLRYDAGVDGARLRDIVERALELAASRIETAGGAGELRAAPVSADFRIMSDALISERIADALVLKLQG